MSGEKLGHYRIAAKLGAGGMGEVYRARDERLERDVALKLLPAENLQDPAARKRLLQEARVASQLNHPHICTVYEVGESDGRSYIAMELVEGRPLNALVASGPLAAESVIRYGAQIADALAHAHDNGVIHRDLKSANVVVAQDGRAKVLDFGLAFRLETEVSEATQSRVSLEQAGGLAGTLQYLPPEVLRGESHDARSDIWSLGVVLYELAAGQLPFQGKTMFELTSAVLYELPSPLPERLPAGLRGVILRCLSKEAHDRYRSAGEVRAALEALQPEATLTAPAPRVRRSRKMLLKMRATMRKKWATFALLTASVFAGGAFGYFGTGEAREFSWLRILRLVIVLSVVAGAYYAVFAHWVTRWSFVVYPDKIRVQGKRRKIDIPFRDIESVELVSWTISYHPVRGLQNAWMEISVAANPRYPKLGEILQWRGERRVLKVKCRGLGRIHGYFLDVEQPERFLETLDRARERYHARAAPGAAVAPSPAS